MISRRTLLTGTAALAAYAALPKAAMATPPNVIAGAIRWDAWYDTTDTDNLAAQNALSPQRWQFRAPWFAQAINQNLLRANGSQANMDLECQMAANAGIKYWAFDQYFPGPDYGFANGWNLYQSSAYNNLVNWCWMTSDHVLGSTGNYASSVATLVSQFQQSNYQKVLTNRPLMYWNQTSVSGYWGSYANLSPALAALNAACASAGLGNPYLVICGGVPGSANLATQLGADAISSYVSLTPSPVGQPSTYPAMVTAAEGFWSQMASSYPHTVPICNTGWDTRPLKQNPTPWQLSYAPAYNGLSNYVTPGTPAQIASHFQDAVNYTLANPTIVPSTAILIYAWTECAEGGGCLIPTIGDPPQAGNTTNLLTAVKGVLNPP